MPLSADWGRGELRDLYQAHRWSLVRLASLLLHDTVDAEEVVQDAFVQTYLAWNRLRDPDKRLSYIRSAVLNGARSRLRHRKVVGRLDPGQARVGPSPEAAMEAGDDRRRVMAALRSLPDRQRECLVLRYYLDLSEADIAMTLGISAGSVKTHSHRGLAALAARLEAR
ncbi:MAG: SigE family RNA polymerase sigma factor [Actinomycetota bacterium]|nr:SigE family RNA polymerase sigma factor [Actinomycetota bacterium]